MERSGFCNFRPRDLVLFFATEWWQEVSVVRLAVYSLSAFLTHAFVLKIMVKYQRAEPKRKKPCKGRQ